MDRDDKPRIRYSDVAKPESTVGKKARNGAEGLGYLLAISIPWAVNEFVPYPIPYEILSAFSGWVVGEAVRVRERIGERFFS